MKKSLFLIFFVAVCVVTSAVFSGVLSGLLFPEGALTGSLLMLLNYVLTFGLTIAILVVFRRAFSWRLPTLVPEFRRVNFTLVILSLLGILAAGIVAEPLLRFVPEWGLGDLYDKMRGGVWAVVTVVFLAPVLEEYLFRGVVQRNAVRFTGSPYAGILLASVAFAVVHAVPQQMVMAFLSSLIIGGVYYITNSLMTVVILHLLNNGLAYTLFLYLGVSSSILEPFSPSPGLYWCVYGLSAAYVLLGLWLLAQQISKLQKAERAGCGPANPQQ